jgi:hypothetical protein
MLPHLTTLSASTQEVIHSTFALLSRSVLNMEWIIELHWQQSMWRWLEKNGDRRMGRKKSFKREKVRKEKLLYRSERRRINSLMRRKSGLNARMAHIVFNHGSSVSSIPKTRSFSLNLISFSTGKLKKTNLLPSQPVSAVRARGKALQRRWKLKGPPLPLASDSIKV